MNKTVAEVNKERRNHDGKFEDFPVGCKVQIVCVAQDFHFFRGDELGEVIDNNGKYLGVVVKFDEPKHFKDGRVVKSFHFGPKDLLRIDRPNYCKTCGQKLKYNE